MTGRFPARVFRAGSEPDPRFSLANERTFLAWIRTALALIAAGVALQAFVPSMEPALRLVASLLLISAGSVLAGQAWLAWTRTEKALRENRPLPSTPLMLPSALLVIAVGALMVVGVLAP